MLNERVFRGLSSGSQTQSRAQDFHLNVRLAVRIFIVDPLDKIRNFLLGSKFSSHLDVEFNQMLFLYLFRRPYFLHFN